MRTILRGRAPAATSSRRAFPAHKTYGVTALTPFFKVGVAKITVNTK